MGNELTDIIERFGIINMIGLVIGAISYVLALTSFILDVSRKILRKYWAETLTEKSRSGKNTVNNLKYKKGEVMTEREKMYQNRPYLDDNELRQQYYKCQKLLYKFNQCKQTQKKQRVHIIKKILGKTGKKISVNTPFRCDYGYRIEVGENFFANYGLTVLDSGKVVIGNDVLIGPNTSIYAAGHPINAEKRREGYNVGTDIHIGNDVWIGGNSVILANIGDGTVIGAGSVVCKDIPDGVVAAGNPCKVIRKITEKDKII